MHDHISLSPIVGAQAALAPLGPFHLSAVLPQVTAGELTAHLYAAVICQLFNLEDQQNSLVLQQIWC